MRSRRVHPLRNTAGRPGATPTLGLLDKSKPQNTNKDQIDSDDEIEQSWHQQDEDARNQGDDRLKMSNTNDHVFSPYTR